MDVGVMPSILLAAPLECVDNQLMDRHMLCPSLTMLVGRTVNNRSRTSELKPVTTL